MSVAEEGLTAPGSVLEDTLGRLAKKSGVKATLLLDRTTGAILKMDGQVTALRTATSSSSSSSRRGAKDGSENNTKTDSTPADGSDQDGNSTAAAANDETRGARELAALVWGYVKTSSDLVAAIEAEDELKLLRLRTKRQELVIVPDAKYLLVVVHDTPPA